MPNNIDALSDDDLLTRFAGQPRAVAAPAAPSIDQLSDDDLLAHFAGPDEKGKNVNGDVWGGFRNFASSTLLGAGPTISAAANATKETVKDIARDVPVKEAAGSFMDRYEQAKAIYSAAKEQCAQEHPAAAALTQAGGQVAGTVPIMLG